MFELSDAVLCADGPLRNLVEWAMARSIGAARARNATAGLALPRAADGRIAVGVDVSPWLRPDAPTSPQRLFCHIYDRGQGKAQMIPGRPYSITAAWEPGRSWLNRGPRRGPARPAR